MVNSIFICRYSCRSPFLTEPGINSVDSIQLSPPVRHRGSSSSSGGVVSGYLSRPDRLAMHAAQNRAAGLALRLGRRVLSVVREEQAEICPVKPKPDTALLRARISYSAKPSGSERH